VADFSLGSVSAEDRGFPGRGATAAADAVELWCWRDAEMVEGEAREKTRSRPKRVCFGAAAGRRQGSTAIWSAGRE